jgi:CRISPR-associated endonuclease/helicase Cas3
MSCPDFEQNFRALMGCSPFAWQKRFYEQLVMGKVRDCDIPTGLGKTAIIAIWLIALANAPAQVPRRLIYIVNRRTVVDQATQIAVRVREFLNNPERLDGDKVLRACLKAISQALKRLAAFDSTDVVAISTLRGELADNEEWKKDPARAAIIIGTIDMIGSKLLFSGYGDGRYGRAHHAGFVGQDTLIAYDEAHLGPAFGELLRAVEKEQRKLGREKTLGIRIMELSATRRSGSGETAVTLEAQDELGDDEPAKSLRKRLDAEKRVILRPVGAKQIRQEIIKCALAHEPNKVKVLIYVRSPEEAQKIEAELRVKREDRVALLAGTLRGFERDDLVERNRVYRALLTPNSKVDETVYLVSTSAGEVGIDLDADHMICDLTTLDSMTQRLGRVNRRGGDQRLARVDVIIPADFEDKSSAAKKAELVATRAALERLPRNDDGSFNASPREVTRLLTKKLSEVKKEAAFQPRPPSVPVTDILFDAWSLTSIRAKLPGRPDVAAFLHGVTNDPRETYVAWRHEVPLLHRGNVSEAGVRDWFRACRIKSHEVLRDRTDRVFDELDAIRKRLGEHAPQKPIILLNERGEAERRTLGDLPHKKEEAAELLAYRTVVLPVEAGGLTESGILDGSEQKRDHIDVAEKTRASLKQPERNRRRFHLQFRDGQFRARGLDEPEFAEETEQNWHNAASPRDAAAKLARQDHLRVVRVTALSKPADEAGTETTEYLVLLEERAELQAEDSEGSPSDNPISIEHHTHDVVKRITDIADALSLDDSLKRVLKVAAELHDSGKSRRVWQDAIFNPNTDKPLAKSSNKGMDWRRLGGYRHEFGSLLDAAQHRAMSQLSDDERELALHLVAAHHGHARPHFEPDTYNFQKNSAEENEAMARETARRFGRLQLCHGRWKLAWLESLLRCADAAASAEPSSQKDSEPAQ